MHWHKKALNLFNALYRARIRQGTQMVLPNIAVFEHASSLLAHIPVKSAAWFKGADTPKAGTDIVIKGQSAPISAQAMPKKPPLVQTNFKIARQQITAAQKPPIRQSDIDALYAAAKNEDHLGLFTQLQKRPELLKHEQVDLGRLLDAMPESRRKTALYERVKHLAKDDVEALRLAAKQNDHQGFLALIQKRPALLTDEQVDMKQLLDVMPESHRKTELYERLKPFMKSDTDDIFINAETDLPNRYIYSQ